MKDIFIIIPTLNPNEKLMGKFVNELSKTFKNILVVDDGSKKEYQAFFKNLENDGIIVLHHYKNLGKGRALKDAYNYLLVHYPNLKGTVSADDDGQHSVSDIKKVAQAVLTNDNGLVLGCRDFDLAHVPKRSRFGNKITRTVMNLFVGVKITDTQTGLRGMSKDVMVKLVDSKGERFDYETTTLVDTTTKDIDIVEVTIDTIYEHGNEGSHFNPITDSIAIYKTFIKYIFSSISAFLIDIILFTIFRKYLFTIIISTITARIISSLYNYFINAKMVFSKANKSSIYKYALLCIIQMFVSAFTVNYLFSLTKINSTLIKIVVDAIIFVVNYVIQNKLIFKEKK